MQKNTQRPHNSAQKSQAESNFTHKRQGPGAKPRAKGTAGHRLTRPRSGLATRRASDGALVPIHLTLTLTRNRALLLPPPPLLQSGVSCAAAAAASPPHKAKWTPDAHLAPCLSLGIPLAVLGARGKGWGIFSCSISCNVCSSGVVNISLYFSPPSSLPFHLFVVVHCSFVRSFSPVKFPDHHL